MALNNWKCQDCNLKMLCYDCNKEKQNQSFKKLLQLLEKRENILCWCNACFSFLVLYWFLICLLLLLFSFVFVFILFFLLFLFCFVFCSLSFLYVFVSLLFYISAFLYFTFVRPHLLLRLYLFFSLIFFFSFLKFSYRFFFYLKTVSLQSQTLKIIIGRNIQDTGSDMKKK